MRLDFPQGLKRVCENSEIFRAVTARLKSYPDNEVLTQTLKPFSP